MAQKHVRMICMRFQWQALLLVLAGCSGIPMKVTPVVRDKDNKLPETQGIRYVIKAPSYAVSLRYKEEERFKDDKPEIETTLEVVLEQQFKTDTVYEARPFGRLLSETEVSITQEADGTLTAVTAGETDKSADAIMAVASLTSAALVKTTTTLKGRVADLDKFIEEGKKLHASRREMLKTLAAKRDFATNAPKDLRERLEELEGLSRELKALDEELESRRFKLKKEEYWLKIDDAEYGSKSTAWVQMELSK